MTAVAFPLGPLGLVLSRLHKVQKNATGWLARCPAHADGRPSLSISEGRNGGVVLHCFAGCSNDSIVAALNLEWRDLAPDSPTSPGAAVSGRTSFKIVAEYNYVDADGNLRFQVVRLDPKDFRQRVPGGPTGWTYSMKGVERVLYHLPAILKAKAENRVVFVVEGEKDANTLAELGLVATTNPGGAKKWQPQYTETLRGANVVLVPDNDKPGREHARLIAEQLRQVAKDLRVIEVPAPHKDVTDWVSDGATIDDIKRLVLAAPAWNPDDVASPISSAVAAPPAGPPPPTAAAADPSFNLTDIGNAERLVAQHGNDIRYVAAWKQWLIWDGHRFQKDKTHAIEHMAKDTVRAIRAEADRVQHDDAKLAKALRAHADDSESNKAITSLLARAKAERGIGVTVDQLDADPWMLTVQNGTLNLRTGTLKPHDRADLATKMVPIAYDADAPCDRWEAFLHRIMGGNRSLLDFLQRAVGYSLTGMTGEQCLFFLYGSGANGKSTFLEIVRDVVGDYAMQADFTTFLEKKNDGPRNDVARLLGARLVTSIEVGEAKRLNESLVKSLTGSDTIAARLLYSETFEFRPSFKLWLAANHKPVVRGTDTGMWRRFRLVPFTVEIPEHERIDQDVLLADLRAELPGVLAWAVNGCLLWQEEGKLRVPDEVRAATDAYRSESDTLGAFFTDTCELGPMETHRTPATELYAVYAQWCKDNNEYLLSQTAFGRRLEDRGIMHERISENGTKRTVRLGVRLTVRPPSFDQRRGDTGSSGPSRDADASDRGNERPNAAFDDDEGRLL